LEGVINMPEYQICPYIWQDGVPYPAQDEMASPAGMSHILVHDGRKDILSFLHDVSLAVHDGKIYIAWYNSTDNEICGTSLIRGRFSQDEGQTWSEPFTIAGSFAAQGHHYVPVNFFPHGDNLYALITEMIGKNITTALDLFEKLPGPSENWEKVATIADGLITNTPPLKMADGNWIVGGWTPMKNETPAYPVVLVSQGDDIARPWRCCFLYDPFKPDGVRIRCPEITLHLDGPVVTAYVRSGNNEGPSYVFESSDFGRTWPAPMITPMPINGSKMFAGTLSSGKRYLIYNVERGYFVRTLLVIAVAEPGKRAFSHVYKLFEGNDALLDGRGSTWSYPAACEHNGFLYIGCTLQEANNVRCAVIARIPVESL
jgi:hypothetical protein